MSTSTYPVHVDAHLDSGLSRGLWLVKWLLAIPHYVILAFLWLAFVVLSMVAFVAILFTGRYPRSIFDFNVGVLRWTWRVAHYAYGALGTDRYPPFTLEDVADYPAHLSVDYPQRLSRGLVLVKWWLLALPHYLVVAFFLGGGVYVANEAATSEHAPWIWGGGLIGLLVLVAAVVLLFTGRYPQPIYDLVLGMNRWVLRVAAYAGLMTDQYPPFRLDQGGDDPAHGDLTMPPKPSAPPTPTAAETAAQRATAPPGAVAPSAWTAGRIVSLVMGCLLLAGSVGIGLGGTALAFADTALRDDAGFVMSSETAFASDTYAITSTDVALHADAPAGLLPQRILGDAKITATGSDTPVFVGVAASSDVEAYLGDVSHATVTDLAADDGPAYRKAAGGAPMALPADMEIWVAQDQGVGDLSLVWPLESGDWTVVVMNADASRGIAADLAAGAAVPALGWTVAVLLSVAGTGLVFAIVLIVLALPVGDKQ